MNPILDENKSKILKKIILLDNAAKGEAELGNTEAAEAFAAKVNRLMLEHELSVSDIEYASNTKAEPIIEMIVNLDAYGIPRTKTRSEWQQRMASIIAQAHLCRIMVRPGSNHIWFVGTKSHTTVAEYAYGILVPVVERLSKKAELAYWKATGSGRGIHNKALGYRAAWIDGFIGRLFERFKESRQQAVNTGAISTGTSLVRLSSALARVDEHLRAMAGGKKTAPLSKTSSHNWQGHADGRAAADKIDLNRRGVGASASRRELK